MTEAPASLASPDAPQGLAAVVSQEPIFDPYTYIFHNRVPYYNALFMGTWYGQIAVTPAAHSTTPLLPAQQPLRVPHPHCVIDNSRNQYSPDPNGSYWSQRTIVAKANKSPFPSSSPKASSRTTLAPTGCKPSSRTAKPPPAAGSACGTTSAATTQTRTAPPRSADLASSPR
ncbi:MAG: hypothetical protein U1U88_001425 [Lawsonella clevelandensis]